SHHALYYASLCLKVPQRRPWNTEIANSSFIFKLAVFQGFVVAQMKLNSDTLRVVQVNTEFYEHLL
ncbi:MAG: hypothetical protein UD961_03910, partial [Bacteroidales bacterium]|nr:hypothetical protein [Bacteroidales bacterium]